MNGILFAAWALSFGLTFGSVYRNPILPLDVSDLDAIRVGSDYYAISSTIQFSPGMLVLQSKDLVHWRMIGHVVPDLTALDPNLNWDRMDQYGKGVWAGSLRYHDGRFWVYFNVASTGFFMATADNPAGPWTAVHNLWRVAGWDDPCPFWDDDGQGYLVATNFADDYRIHLFKLSVDGTRLVPGFDRVIHQSKGSEANKLYKFHGLYYHLFSDVRPEGRVVEMERAKSLEGPWEIRQLNHVNAKVDKEPNQGGLVEDGAGNWYFVSHQGTGDWEGRAGVLLPVTWIEGWPIIGSAGADGIGTMVWSGRTPISGLPSTRLAHSDEFAQPALAPDWEWNHQPRVEKWSLAESAGSLRLHAFQPVHDDFFGVGNVLTQRSLRVDHCQVTARLKLDGMAAGDVAGLAHFAKTYGLLEVRQTGATRKIQMANTPKNVASIPLRGSWVWLRSSWNSDGVSQFAYSTDGKHFTNMGEPYALTWGHYRGDRIGLFTYSQEPDGGWVDIDSFTYLAGAVN